jgi:hypothetical protein
LVMLAMPPVVEKLSIKSFELHADV